MLFEVNLWISGSFAEEDSKRTRYGQYWRDSRSSFCWAGLESLWIFGVSHKIVTRFCNSGSILKNFIPLSTRKFKAISFLMVGSGS